MAKITLKSFFGTLISQAINTTFMRLFSLSIRKHLAVKIDKQYWIPLRHILSMALIRDWAEHDANEFHRFLWSQHLGYAWYYETKHSFGKQNLVLTRQMLFEDLKVFTEKHSELQKEPVDFQSVFEVGCSSGYMLRFIETDLFPAAKVLEGIDIDRQALELGRKYLHQHKSKINLIESDMSEIDLLLGKRKFDLILCTGVLLYLNENVAKDVVRSMLKHCNKLLVIKELAHPTVDNSKLEHSEFRQTDKTFIHNIDRMISASGGKVFFHRWEGSKLYEGQSVYFVFSTCGAESSQYA